MECFIQNLYEPLYTQKLMVLLMDILLAKLNQLFLDDSNLIIVYEKMYTGVIAKLDFPSKN